MKKIKIELLLLVLFVALVDIFCFKLYKNITHQQADLIAITKQISNLNTNTNRIDEQNSVLPESINPNDKRWAKIKLVRKIIQDDIATSGLKYDLTIKDLTDIAAAVVDYASEFDIKMSSVLATIRVESAYNKRAISKSGAQGLMQLMPETAKECADDLNMKYYNAFRIKDNIKLGT